MASATTSPGTKSMGHFESKGITGTRPATRADTTLYNPWNALTTPVVELPMTTEGRKMTWGTVAAETISSDSRLDAAERTAVTPRSPAATAWRNAVLTW